MSIVLMMTRHPDEYDVLLKLLTTDFTRPTPQIYAVQGLRVLQRHDGITGTVQSLDTLRGELTEPVSGRAVRLVPIRPAVTLRSFSLLFLFVSRLRKKSHG